MSVYGKSIGGALDRASRRGAERPPGPRTPNIDAPTRILDDAAVAEIAKMPGVVYVEPAVFFLVEIRVNGKTLGGAEPGRPLGAHDLSRAEARDRVAIQVAEDHVLNLRLREV